MKRPQALRVRIETVIDKGVHRISPSRNEGSAGGCALAKRRAATKASRGISGFSAAISSRLSPCNNRASMARDLRLSTKNGERAAKRQVMSFAALSLGSESFEHCFGITSQNKEQGASCATRRAGPILPLSKRADGCSENRRELLAREASLLTNRNNIGGGWRRVDLEARNRLAPRMRRRLFQALHKIIEQRIFFIFVSLRGWFQRDAAARPSARWKDRLARSWRRRAADKSATSGHRSSR